MSFDSYGIDPRCLRILHAQQIVEPTPIQAQAIPVALSGHDAIAIAQTGTGKTLAFSLPSLSNLASRPMRGNRMLVLLPTRELAQQVQTVMEPFARTLGLRTVAVYGGVGMTKQADALRHGRSVVVATPGRLLDHMNRGNVSFDALEILVLDEADRMLDMGFMPDLRRILARLPKKRQTMMFSATFPDPIARLAKDMLHEPERLVAGEVARPVDAVNQALYTVQHTDKLALLSDLLRNKEVQSALVFIRTKARTDRVARALHKAGFKAQPIHGDRTQQQRDKALAGFRDGRYNILVATDVAARGLDISDISHVINFDIPSSPEDYVHRIGRTARCGKTGEAITFVSPDEHTALMGIERALGRNLPSVEWERSVPVIRLFHPKGEKPAQGRVASHRRRSFGRSSRRRF